MKARRETFINHYIRTKNATESAIEAGYAVKSARVTGHRLVTNDNIKKIIEARFKEIELRYNLSRDDYIKRTIKLHEDSKHPSTRQRYWELLGKVLGYTKETIEHTGTFQPPPVFYNTITLDKSAKETSKRITEVT